MRTTPRWAESGDLAPFAGQLPRGPADLLGPHLGRVRDALARRPAPPAALRPARLRRLRGLGGGGRLADVSVPELRRWSAAGCPSCSGWPSSSSSLRCRTWAWRA